MGFEIPVCQLMYLFRIVASKNFTIPNGLKFGKIVYIYPGFCCSPVNYKGPLVRNRIPTHLNRLGEKFH